MAHTKQTARKNTGGKQIAMARGMDPAPKPKPKRGRLIVKWSLNTRRTSLMKKTPSQSRVLVRQRELLDRFT